MRVRPLVGWSVGMGFGLGLVFGLGVSYLNRPTPEPLSNEAVIARARDLGMRPLTELAGGEVILTVGPGTTAEQLASALQKAGLVADPADFVRRAGGRAPKEGVFRLPAGIGLDGLVKEFFAG
jgi:hypothetical protein